MRNRRLKLLSACLLLLLIPLVSVGQEQTAAPGDPKEQTTPVETPAGVDKGPVAPAVAPLSDSYSFVQSLMALSFVLGLIFLAAYFFKKITGVKTGMLRGAKVPIHMVSNMPLGDRKFLSIVEIQGKHYFIGITQESINLLSELELDLPEPEAEPSGEGFESILHKARALLNKSKKQ